MVAPPDSNGRYQLVVAEDTSASERVYLYLHVVSHIFLEQIPPLGTILEPRTRLWVSAHDSALLDPAIDQHWKADILAGMILWGSCAEVCERTSADEQVSCWARDRSRLMLASHLSMLVPGVRFRLLRYVLQSGFGRRMLRRLLLILRGAYRLHGIHMRLMHAAVVEDARKALYVTEVVSAAPQLAHLGFHGLCEAAKR